VTAPRLVIEPLGPGPSAEELARRASARPGLVCLRGRFADGRPLLTSHPLRVLTGVFPPDQPDDGADGLGDCVGGGWFGVAGYDAGATRFAFHDHVVRLVDGRWRFEALWTPERAVALDGLRDKWAGLISADDTGIAGGGWTLSAFDGPAEAVHLAAVERAVELIRAGELYQVNICTRLATDFTGDPAALFARAAAELDPAFGAYLAGTATGDAVVCLSPELFWRRRGRELRSAPIKGTLPVARGNARALRRSAKDVAENVMIVDLVRNDLGRVCEIGSVRPSALLDVVERVGVLHLESAVTGRVRAGVGDAEVTAALFPPGSVTGAPKPRAGEVIAQLEGSPRGAYTGCVGFVSPCWGAEFAVAIRTLELRDGRAELGVGGGITVDSVPELEWRECLHKAAPVARAAGGSLAPGLLRSPPRPTPAQLDGGVLETVLALDGVPVRLADHLARLDRSVRELYGVGLPEGLADEVCLAAGRAAATRAAIRIVAGPDGARPVVTVAPAPARPTATAVFVSDRPAGCWRHKWADRSWAIAAESAVDGAPLFLGRDGAVLETSRGNVVLVDRDGTLVTPPLRDDLLPGVTRRALLDLARDAGRAVELRSFGLDELSTSIAFWTSSLSGAVPMTSVDGVVLPRADAVVESVAQALVGADTIGARHGR